MSLTAARGAYNGCRGGVRHEQAPAARGKTCIRPISGDLNHDATFASWPSSGAAGPFYVRDLRYSFGLPPPRIVGGRRLRASQMGACCSPLPTCTHHAARKLTPLWSLARGDEASQRNQKLARQRHDHRLTRGLRPSGAPGTIGPSHCRWRRKAPDQLDKHCRRASPFARRRLLLSSGKPQAGHSAPLRGDNAIRANWIWWTSMSAVSTATPMTRAMRRTIACGPSGAAGAAASLRRQSPSMI